MIHVGNNHHHKLIWLPFYTELSHVSIYFPQGRSPATLPPSPLLPPEDHPPTLQPCYLWRTWASASPLTPGTCRVPVHLLPPPKPPLWETAPTPRRTNAMPAPPALIFLHDTHHLLMRCLLFVTGLFLCPAPTRWVLYLLCSLEDPLATAFPAVTHRSIPDPSLGPGPASPD